MALPFPPNINRSRSQACREHGQHCPGSALGFRGHVDDAAGPPRARRQVLAKPGLTDLKASGDITALQLRTEHERTTWRAPCGTRLEVRVQRPVLSGTESAVGSARTATPPPLVFIHGLYRAAWCWEEAFMPFFAARGHECFALSLRGQGRSEVAAAGAPAHEEWRDGLPMSVVMDDITGFVASLQEAPILVGHSLGGVFVQEYLARIAASGSTTGQNMLGGAKSSPSAASAAQVPPRLAGAVLLASATSGTVMAFGDFIRDVGLFEFCYQMWLVATQSQLKSQEVAHKLWWGPDVCEADAARYFKAACESSRVLPYRAQEIFAWGPSAAGPAAGLPPVLAVGGACDRVIRPWQVSAARPHWNADVTILPDATHDLMLGPSSLSAASTVWEWMEATGLALSEAGAVQQDAQ